MNYINTAIAWIRKHIFTICLVVCIIATGLMVRSCILGGKAVSILDTHPTILTDKQAKKIEDKANTILAHAVVNKQKADSTLKKAETKEAHVQQQLAVIDSLTKLHNEIILDSTGPISVTADYLLHYVPSTD